MENLDIIFKKISNEENLSEEEIYVLLKTVSNDYNCFLRLMFSLPKTKSLEDTIYKEDNKVSLYAYMRLLTNIGDRSKRIKKFKQSTEYDYIFRKNDKPFNPTKLEENSFSSTSLENRLKVYNWR